MTEVFVEQPLALPVSAKYLYSNVRPQWFKMVLPVIKQIILTFFLEILNPEGHQNCSISSKVTANSLNVCILPTSGVASGRVCACKLRSRLVFSCVELSFPIVKCLV